MWFETFEICPSDFFFFAEQMAAESFKEGYNNAFSNRYAHLTDKTTGDEVRKLYDEWAAEYDKVG